MIATLKARHAEVGCRDMQALQQHLVDDAVFDSLHQPMGAMLQRLG